MRETSTKVAKSTTQNRQEKNLKDKDQGFSVELIEALRMLLQTLFEQFALKKQN